MKTRNPFSYIKLAFVLTAPLFLWGCATTYDLTVDSLKNPHVVPSGESYRLVDMSPGASEQSLMTQEADRWIRNALLGKGLYEAPDPANADMIIRVKYALEAPRTKLVNYSTPMYPYPYPYFHERYSYVRIPIRNKDGHIIGTRVVARPGAFWGWGWGYDRDFYPDFYNSVQSVTVYPKYLRLTATSNPKKTGDKHPVHLWTVTVTNDDENGDMRQMLPVMAAAAAKYVGTDSKTQRYITIRADDPGVASVEKGGSS